MGIKYNWIYPNYDENFIKELESYSISKNIAKILNARNITDMTSVKKYFSDEYEEGYDPFLMHDMQKAVDRINEAIENEEKILVYGDYDADGITSTVLLVETLISMGANVSSYIPNRFEEGYGPNKEAFTKIIDSGITLIITVDNGIAGVEEVDLANELGCDVIVTDHHKIQDTIPNAYAIIHPEHPEGNYPFKKLAGVGVAFKLAHALLEIFPDFLLDLVAIGTIADMVSITDENRIFVKQGLELINEDPRIGLKMLLELSGIDTKIDEQTVGFYIAPKLNSIGRMDSAKLGLTFLMAEEPVTARALAEQIEQYNIQRKQVTEDIVKDVISKIENSEKKQKNVIMVSGEYHEGVLGIVASNIVEKYQKPVFIMNEKEGVLKGSARSIFDFNIYVAMNKISDLFLAFGGHTLAAGFSFEKSNFEKIEEFLDNEFEEFKQNNNLKANKNIDIVTSLEDISYQFLNSLDALKPYGMDFEKPTVLIENAMVLNKAYFGSEKQYLRLTIADEVGNLDCITFKDSVTFDKVEKNDIIDLVCNIDKNNFNGRTKLQAHIIDIHIKEFLFEDLRFINYDIANIDINCLKLSKYKDDKDNNFYQYKDLDSLIDEEFEYIYLLDIPTSKEYLYKIINLKPKKVFLICEEKQVLSDVYLIDKNRLIKLFNLILSTNNKQINVAQQLDKLLAVLKTNVDSLKIMIQIFKELELINFVNNTIILNPDYKTVDLKKSSSFISMENIFEVENLLLKESITNINKILEV
ncbi:single-stranded-DNA-specific exonuclease RecJ [Gemella haemolysans]|uniref:Single-stranded-DNA-specific exonuclease RecJ n=1 Tax=Gemella haemolysans ATCC 10379 TaxID=546270 RepID=C5NYP0_9BACL|nr:single-stranded-DNA-specific exonuclease RecJ [Gemella haemolysans]EER68140.1 single-stranded-DNA-specific exonuclease RecJ [Gemella haemolysans ATCC 10379]KAA8709384.1 single-stranded-DNA-specific exonuclease RecJ [Gemella haemolysans]UBH83085.1 single-stranded-DNA-specific exonuclease RecJ [Gemella haemolysans]VEI38643.1 Single-stranded-DNA-specific exonuclease recJ [Gemella haemolysans]